MDCSNSTFGRGITLLAAIFSSSFTLAAERLSLTHMPLASLQKKIPVSWSHPPVQSVVAKSQDFLLLERHTDAQQTEHIRMQQRYMGFPVWGAYAVFHRKLTPYQGASVQINGVIYQQLQQDLGACPEGFVSHADQILQRYLAQFQPTEIVNQSIQPIIYIDEQRRAHWAYHIMVYLQPENEFPSRPMSIVAADTGKILSKWNALNTLYQAVYGLGFGGNHRIGKLQYGKELPYLNVLRDSESGTCFLENNDIRVVDMQHRIHYPNIPMRFPCEENSQDKKYWTGYEADGYDRANGGYSVSNDAMYFGELVKKMYHDRYGVEVLQLGQHSLKMIFRVHFSRYFANAFWDGQQMTFGDGDGVLHPLVALSITAHELSHGFTQLHSGLVYRGQAGGINESFSDMASQAAEDFVYGKPSWHVGADVLKGQGALRWFQHPKRDGVSIERAIDYQTDMDVHYSSGVYNYLFYLLANHVGWTTQKAFHVMLKANMDYWTPTTNFREGACGILAATRDLGFSEEDVKDALDEVVIDYGDC